MVIHISKKVEYNFLKTEIKRLKLHLEILEDTETKKEIKDKKKNY